MLLELLFGFDLFLGWQWVLLFRNHMVELLNQVRVLLDLSVNLFGLLVHLFGLQVWIERGELRNELEGNSLNEFEKKEMNQFKNGLKSS